MSQASQPANAADALASVSAGLSLLAGLEATELTAVEQAECLRAMERAHAQLVAARSTVLAAFTAARAFEDDAAGGPQSWLRWQTRITGAAASDAVAWTQRLADHPAIATALASGQISVVMGPQDLLVVRPAARRGPRGRGPDSPGRRGGRSGPA